MNFKDKMATANKGNNAKSGAKYGTSESVSARNPFIQVNRENVRDEIIDSLVHAKNEIKVDDKNDTKVFTKKPFIQVNHETTRYGSKVDIKNDAKVFTKKPFIQVNHETTRDEINSNISVFGVPHVEKCVKKNENGTPVFKNGNPVYSYYVKSLWNLKNGEIHTIMISQSTMAYYDAKTCDMYSFKINFEDKSEKDFKALLDGKTIFGVTLKYGEKIDPNDSTFIHRSISFNAKMNDLFNQTSKIAEKINEILSGKVTVEELSVPAKGLTILKKDFPELTKSKTKTFVPVASSPEFVSAVASASASASASVTAPSPAKKEEKVEKVEKKEENSIKIAVKDSSVATVLADLIKTFEFERNAIYNLSAEEFKLEKEISNSDEEMKQFEIEMKRQLEEGKARIIKNKSDNINKLEIVKTNKKAAILENEKTSKQLIDDISKPSFSPTEKYDSWSTI